MAKGSLRYVYAYRKGTSICGTPFSKGTPIIMCGTFRVLPTEIDQVMREGVRPYYSSEEEKAIDDRAKERFFLKRISNQITNDIKRKTNYKGQVVKNWLPGNANVRFTSGGVTKAYLEINEKEATVQIRWPVRTPRSPYGVQDASFHFADPELFIKAADKLIEVLKIKRIDYT